MISIRTCRPEDLETVQELVRTAPPLDRHTPYTYWVLLTFYSDGCLLAEEEGEPAGFVTAVPCGEDSLFVWQIGVASGFRGRGAAALLLNALLEHNPGLRELQFTIAPENRPSRRLFERFAVERGGELELMEEMPLGEERFRIALPGE